jgi:hypothetical protein
MKKLAPYNNQIILIIDNLEVDKNGEFSSHDFIKRFSKEFQKKYIELLYEYKDSGHAFKSLHGQIAKHLSENNSLFKIEKADRKGSEDIFGDIVEVQWWKKVI